MGIYANERDVWNRVKGQEVRYAKDSAKHLGSCYCYDCMNHEIVITRDEKITAPKIGAIDRPIDRGDGGSTTYYELPKGATELWQIIKYKKMEHGIGEAFCALYRLNNNGEYLRNLKKARYYLDCAIKYEESK